MELNILAASDEAGLLLCATNDYRRVFVIGHSEYDAGTLNKEYQRDKALGLKIAMPKNYFPNDDDTKEPIARWRAHGNLLFSNWLNYCLYQTTPYDIETIK